MNFPHVGQVFTLRRTRLTRKRDGSTKFESETVVGVTSLTANRATPKRLLELNRGHWGIENRLHHVRDVTYDEDRSQVRSANAPQVLAALRNTAISLLRLAGSAVIKPANRLIAANVHLALRLIGVGSRA